MINYDDYLTMSDKDLNKIISHVKNIQHQRKQAAITSLKNNDYQYLKSYIDNISTTLEPKMIDIISVDNYNENNMLFVEQLKRTTNWSQIINNNCLNIFSEIMQHQNLLEKYYPQYEDVLVYYINNRFGFHDLPDESINFLMDKKLINFDEPNFLNIYMRNPSENLLIYCLNNNKSMNIDEQNIKSFYLNSFGRWENSTSRLLEEKHPQLKQLTLDDFLSNVVRYGNPKAVIDDKDIYENVKTLIKMNDPDMRYTLETFSIKDSHLLLMIKALNNTSPTNNDNVIVLADYIKDKQPELKETFIHSISLANNGNFKKIFEKILLTFKLDGDLEDKDTIKRNKI